MWLLRKIAFPFSLVYGWVVWIRNALYDRGIFMSKHYKTPILCVGNLSVGGTGKTPMVEYLIQNLPDKKVAVLSRGYKRKSVGFVLADQKSTVATLGDEPYQIFSKFPKVTVAVDA
ncbi:MAG: tetraacyldisaccharide 4'-kinase, partial [Flavobacteriaceae bacterium]